MPATCAAATRSPSTHPTYDLLASVFVEFSLTQLCYGKSWYHFYAGVRNELGKLEDVNNQMLLKLREHSRHAHAAVLWLRNNKEQFRGKIHEPIMTVVRASFNTCRVSIG